MKKLSRLFSSILTATFLTAVFLGTFAKPVVADSTGFLSLINTYRQQNGVGALVEDQNLTNAACWLASDLDINGFSHTDSLDRDMSQRLTAFGVSGSRAENIFYTTSGSAASYAFDAWKNSSGHNTNMLSGTYTRIGIGRVNINGKWYWTTDFANGSATSLTNQCGTSINPSSPPPAQPTPPPASVNPPAPAIAVPVTVTESTRTATVAAESVSLEIASKSATSSTRTIKIGTESAEMTQPTALVKGLALGSILLLNLALFSFLFWKFLHRFR